VRKTSNFSRDLITGSTSIPEQALRDLSVLLMVSSIKTMQNKEAALGREGFKEWIAKALKNGAGIAHKYTTQTPKAPPLPGIIKEGKKGLFDPQDKVDHFARQWNKPWGKNKNDTIKIYDDIELICQDA
jgi:hypothetical protein